jgi:hypothetical protein
LANSSGAGAGENALTASELSDLGKLKIRELAYLCRGVREAVVVEHQGLERREPRHRCRHEAVEAVAREVEILHHRRQAVDDACREHPGEGVVGDVEEAELGAGVERGGREGASCWNRPGTLDLTHTRDSDARKKMNSGFGRRTPRRRNRPVSWLD